MNQIPVAMIDHDELFYIHVDHRQAPISVTNSQRKVVWQAELSDNLYASPLAYNHGRFGFIEFNLRGSNQYFDAETNLHYNTNRYFDAKNEKYITPDPLGLAVGSDLYVFGLGQPHTLNDPLGLAPKLINDNQVKNATFDQKLQDIIQRAVPKLPGLIGNALLEMVQPTNLAIMGAILGVWAISQATPVGWVADLALLGYSIYTLGSGIINLYQMFVNLNNDTKCAKNVNALNKAADRLARSLVTSTGEIVGGLTGTWGIRASGGVERIATGLKTVFAYGKRQVAKVSINILKLTIKRPDTKSVKYPKDMSKWMQPNGNPIWPTAELGFPDGALPATVRQIKLPAGTILDRFGGEKGSFLGVYNTPYEMRSLAPYSQNADYYVYRVIKPLPVESGTIAPWFGMKGGGVQYKASGSIENLIASGYIERVAGPIKP